MASLEKWLISGCFCCFLINKSFWFSLCGSMHRQREEINVYSDKQLTSAQVQSPFSPSHTRLTIDVEEDEFPLCIVTHRHTGRYHIHKVSKFSCNIKDEWLIKSYIIIFECECEKYLKSKLLLNILFFFFWYRLWGQNMSGSQINKLIIWSHFRQDLVKSYRSPVFCHILPECSHWCRSRRFSAATPPHWSTARRDLPYPEHHPQTGI